ncbi:hypothetical protein [Algibacter luteus]|uniref:Uncharacterized protein n=1 Tax=Algibacter luteus TaxID=1178825 RepID=A0A1M6D0W4_9FLAO|nr:hypothetical protein [Algibacter luteus]SHI66751.1 hypothetical protein SAMN05216261_1301 [Algibacter luteus]
MRNNSYLLSFSVFLALFSFSCSVEEVDEFSFETEETFTSKISSESKKGKSKIEICHYNEGTNSFERISISENGLNGHKNHKNDILVFDIDGDGYPAENDCGINFREDGLWDCDDSNAELNPETVWYLDADGDKFAASSIQGCDSPGEGYTLEEMPTTDLDDNNPAVQNEVDCFNHIVGHYYGSKYHGANLFELDFIVSYQNDEYYMNGSLTETKSDGEIKVHDLNLNIHSVNELYSKFYSFRYDESYPINSGSGYYSCEIITVMIGISGSGIPGVQAFNAVKIK